MCLMILWWMKKTIRNLYSSSYSKETFVTSNQLAYQPPRYSNQVIGKDQVLAQDVSDSGFTRLPKYDPSSQGHVLDLI